ncbi:hypothetical protein P5F61_14760 [Clostridium perfringens]|nr:hypothetical protein [Clostridium perfringens]MDM0752330.1 hypothetical protein [Clostridium perfringens]
MKINDDIIQVIDYLVNAISNGKYLYYQVSYIPETKLDDKEFLNRLDTKIREKYQTNKTKSERLNLRRKEKARFLAIRYKNILIIMHTEGDFEVSKNEKWMDIRKNKIELKTSEYTTYCIGFGKNKSKKSNKNAGRSVSVTLGADTYNLIKLSCVDAIRYKKSIRKLYYEWNKINGFNGWSGINKQKMQLKEYLIIAVCKEFGMKKTAAEKLFRVNTYKAKVSKGKDKPLDDLLEDAINSIKLEEEQQRILDEAFLEKATETGLSPPVADKKLQV